ncbi:MAG: hypothetical protein ACTHXA_13800 [Gulosibacter sp.]|uniref:hypothetical protein n=1 Tax=Gulosibacter sp. TaxID=2817531 RepID=UPI003F9195EA
MTRTLSSKLKLVVSAAALASVVALSGCSVVEDLTGNGSEVDSCDTSQDGCIEVFGHADTWLQPEYANGIAAAWSPGSEDSDICGISGSIAVVGFMQGNKVYEISGIDMRTDETLWTIDEGSCSYFAGIGGSVFIEVEGEDSEYTLTQVDIESGEQQDVHTADENLHVEEAFGELDDTFFLTVNEGDGSEVFAIHDGEVLWQEPVGSDGATPTVCELLGEQIGCNTTSTEGAVVTVLDAETGEPTLESMMLPDSALQVAWATDGFVALTNFTEPLPAFDFDGNELDPIEFGGVPNSSQLLPTSFVSLSQLDGNSVFATDAAGNTVATVDEDGTVVLAGADDSRTLDIRASFDATSAATADGTAVLVKGTTTTAQLFDQEGNELAIGGLSTSNSPFVVGGMLVAATSSKSPAVVYPPVWEE